MTVYEPKVGHHARVTVGGLVVGVTYDRPADRTGASVLTGCWIRNHDAGGEDAFIPAALIESIVRLIDPVVFAPNDAVQETWRSHVVTWVRGPHQWFSADGAATDDTVAEWLADGRAVRLVPEVTP